MTSTANDHANDRPTLLVIDGHSLAFRAFYALPPESFQIASGLHTNAIHGFLSMMLSLISTERPTHLAVAFDLGRHSFRTDEYPEYKGTRGETPPEFIGQVEALTEALHAMNIVTLTSEGFEADDILATLASEGKHAGYEVLLVSGDRDTIQLIDDHVTLLYPTKGVRELTRYTDETVTAKYGVHPHQYPDLAALVGETSDNLPGVPGVGPKTAAKWINAYGGLDEILAHEDEIKGKVGQSLRDHRADAERNRRLNRLVADVPLDRGLDDMRIVGIDRRKVEEVFGELEFRTLGARVRGLDEHLLPVKGGRAEAVGAATGNASAVGASGAGVGDEPDLFLARSIPEPERVSAADLVAHLDGAGTHGVSLSVEGDVLEVGVATEDRAVQASVTIDTPEGARLAAWLDGGAPTVGFDVKRTVKALAAHGLALRGSVGDARLSWYLVDPTRTSYRLEDAVKLYTAEQLRVGDPNQLIVDEDVCEQAQRAWFTLALDGMFRSVLSARGGTHVLEDIELPLTGVLARMELTGIEVDRGLLEAFSDELGARIERITRDAYEEIGREVNLASPKQLQDVLFDQLGMQPTKKLKTGYSTNAEALTDLFEQTGHPFLRLLLQHRDATKLRQMVVTLLGSVAEDGRVHTSYDQTGASTGRLSSTDPNLQNIPVRTEEGRRIRTAFVAPEGSVLVSADYSQIEMRIMAHLSRDEGLIEAFRSGEDLHNYVGSKVFGVSPAEVTPEMRSKVKAMSYGLVYGLSAFGLARQLRIPQGEAKELMSGYFQRFGGVRDYLRHVVDEARERGYTETIHGRRRPFPDLHSTNRIRRQNAERAALNAPIQGSAADIIKIAMLQVDRALAEGGYATRLLLQVHDELVLEVPQGEVDAVVELVTGKMRRAATLDVPLDVHIGIGPNWNAAAH